VRVREQPIESNLDEDIAEHFELQLKLLDDAHTRARGPTARRKIEAKVDELKRELEDLRGKAKIVKHVPMRHMCRFIRRAFQASSPLPNAPLPLSVSTFIPKSSRRVFPC